MYSRGNILLLDPKGLEAAACAFHGAVTRMDRRLRGLIGHLMEEAARLLRAAEHAAP